MQKYSLDDLREMKELTETFMRNLASIAASGRTTWSTGARTHHPW